MTGDGPFAALGHSVARAAGHHRWTVDGAPASAVQSGGSAWVVWHGATYELPIGARERTVEAVTGELVAPMPGRVLAVHGRQGQIVRRGEGLILIEAMKMELRIEAPADGTITAVRCALGGIVERGSRLAEFRPAEEGAASVP